MGTIAIFSVVFFFIGEAAGFVIAAMFSANNDKRTEE